MEDYGQFDAGLPEEEPDDGSVAESPPASPVAMLQQRLQEPTAPPPFTWEQAKASPDIANLEPEDYYRVKQHYYRTYVQPRDPVKFDAWDSSTEPTFAQQFGGAVDQAIASFQRTGAVAAEAVDLPELAATLRQAADKNVQASVVNRYVPRYGAKDFRQVLNLIDGGYWKSLFATGIPGSAPFMVGAGAGAVAGSFAPVVGTMLGAMLGGGGAVILQAFGDAHDEYRAKYPDDPEGANEYAWKTSLVSAVVNAASIPLGAIGMTTGPVKHGLTQIFVQAMAGGADTLTGNAIKQQMLAPDQDLSENLLSSMLQEGIFEAPAMAAGFRAAYKQTHQQRRDAPPIAGVPNYPNPGPPEPGERQAQPDLQSMAPDLEQIPPEAQPLPESSPQDSEAATMPPGMEAQPPAAEPEYEPAMPPEAPLPDEAVPPMEPQAFTAPEAPAQAPLAETPVQSATEPPPVAQAFSEPAFAVGERVTTKDGNVLDVLDVLSDATGQNYYEVRPPGVQSTRIMRLPEEDLQVATKADIQAFNRQELRRRAELATQKAPKEAQPTPQPGAAPSPAPPIPAAEARQDAQQPALDQLKKPPQEGRPGPPVRPTPGERPQVAPPSKTAAKADLEASEALPKKGEPRAHPEAPPGSVEKATAGAPAAQPAGGAGPAAGEPAPAVEPGKAAVRGGERPAEPDEKPLQEAPKAKNEAGPVAREPTFREFMRPRIPEEMPTDNAGLKRMYADWAGREPEKITAADMKAAQEQFETALAQRVREQVQEWQNKRETSEDIFKGLVSWYKRQPKLDFRTSTSVQNQAYSTPFPIAYLANKAAGIERSTSVYEPAAGNGMLLLTATPANVQANELNKVRAENLRAQGFKVTEYDGRTAVADGAIMGRVEAVVANPPFGSTPTFRAEGGYKIQRIDERMAIDALGVLAPDGKAVLILGANNANGVQPEEVPFLNWLWQNHHVAAHFEIDGDLYSRQGANWPLRVLVIDGKRKTGKYYPANSKVPRAMTWEQVYEQFTDLQPKPAGLEAEERPRVGTGRVPGEESETTPERPTVRGLPPEPDQEPAANVRVERPAARLAGPAEGDAEGTVAGGNRPEPVLPGADRPDQLGRGEPAPGGGTATGLEEGAARAEPGRPARIATPAAESHELQAPYLPRSETATDAVLMPVNMEGATHRSLDRLVKAVGPLDDYARKMLGYRTKEDLADALMGVQVDSVAAAIHQAEQGKALIIADATGVGKGRQGAAMIRYGVKRGLLPIYITEKESLFTDLYRDLEGIGSRQLVPYIVNSGAAIEDANGHIVHKSEPAGLQSRTLSEMARGKIPEGHDFILLTYSQLQKAGRKSEALFGMVGQKQRSALMILDESHNAAGASARGRAIQALLANAKAATYMSATFAKRDDNMPVYFRTDIGKAVADPKRLSMAMAMGGLQLEIVVSNMLADAGQIFRRERSMKGISLHNEVLTDAREKHEQHSDQVTAGLRAIKRFDSVFAATYVSDAKKDAEGNGETILPDGTTARTTIDHTEFAAILHNLVRQFLYALKVDTVADRAIAALKANEKPVIAVDGTMGMFMEELAAQEGLVAGSNLEDFRFGRVLERALRNQARYVVKSPQGDSHTVRVPPEKFRGDTKAAYEEALRTIGEITADVPVSPIDWMHKRLKDAGYKVGEVTGRKLAVDYSTETPTILVRTSAEKDRVGVVRAFNNGNIDALVLNTAGATGISLHASETFKDQRVRHMLVAQPALDINTFVQMLGRVHRTGQVVPPKYSLITSDIPAEKRPVSVLTRKLQSLNANTTSNTKSATTLEGADILNKYGDKVVNDLIASHGDMATMLDLHPDTKDIAKKATGRLAILPVKDQHRFYGEIEPAYQSLTSYLSEIGENELETRTLDYDAKPIRSTVIAPADPTEPGNPFMAAAVHQELDIKRQGKPPTPAEVHKWLEEASGPHGAGKVISDYTNALAKDLREAKGKAATPEIAEEMDKIGAQTLSLLRGDLNIGFGARLTIGGESLSGVILGYRSSWKKGQHGNPLAPSRISVEFAVPTGLRKLSIPLSQLVGGNVLESIVRQPAIQLWFGNPTPSRERAQVITGNLLSGYAAITDGLPTGSRPRIATFTNSRGGNELGIILPKAFKLKDLRQEFRFQTPAEVLDYLEAIGHDPGGVYDPGAQTIRFTREGGQYKVYAATSRMIGEKWVTDPEFLTLLGGEFAWKHGSKYASQDIGDRGRAQKAIEYVLGKVPLAASPSQADTAKRIITRHRGEVAFAPTAAEPEEEKQYLKLDQFGHGFETVKESRAPAPYEFEPTEDRSISNEAIDDLRKRLEGQIGKDVVLKIFGNPFAGPSGMKAAGYHDAIARTIGLSYWSDDPKGVIDHEAWHEIMGRLDPERYQMVDATFGPGTGATRKVLAELGRRGYSAALADPSYLTAEEKSAYAYQFWRQGTTFFRPVPEIFGYIKNLLGRLVNALKGMGFETAEDVFRSAGRGEFAERARTAGAVTGIQESRAGAATDRTMRAAARATKEAYRTSWDTPPRTIMDKLFATPFKALPVHRLYAQTMDAMGRWVPERLKAGIMDRYGETDELKAARQARLGEHRQNLRIAQTHVQKLMAAISNREASRIAYKWLTTNDPTTEAGLMAQLPPEARNGLLELKRYIEQLGEESVALGQVSRDSFERNRLAYLHRMYRQYELDENGKPPTWRRAAARLLGDTLKGRGLANWATREDLSASSPGFREAAPNGRKFVRRIRQAASGRVTKAVWVEVGRTMPERFTGEKWSNEQDSTGADLVWEARWIDGNKVGLWRDWTEAERREMGEIDEAAYATARTLFQMQRNIENGHFLRWLARNGNLSVAAVDDLPEGATPLRATGTQHAAYLPNEWVKVPDTEITESGGVRVYGALAGRWVSGPVWNEVRQVVPTDPYPRWKWYDDLVRVFKIGHTALSPTVHVNNIAADLVFAEMADLRSHYVLHSLMDHLAAWRGDEVAAGRLRDFEDSGAAGNTYAAVELKKEILGPLEDALRMEFRDHTGENAPDNPLLLTKALSAMTSVLSGLNAVKNKAVDLYQLEDNVFRYAMYQQARAEGDSRSKAAQRAIDAFLDYDINAPWVNVARRTAFPFLAFTYRAIPKLDQMLREKPWKLLKLAATIGALNAASYALSGGKEDEERALLPDDRAGKIWGLFPRMVRMPWNDARGHPVFLDILRFIPMGDLFLWQQTHSAIPILPMMVPGGPVEWLMEFLANKDSFTGKEITLATDTPAEKASKMAGHLWKGLSPNFVLWPGSYQYDKVFPTLPEPVQEGLRAVGLGGDQPGLDPFGREYPALQAWTNAFGIKVASYPKDLGEYMLRVRANKEVRDLEAQIRVLGFQLGRETISPTQFDARAQKLIDKMQATIDRANQRLRKASGAE